MIQNIKTKDFFLTGMVESQRVADVGKIVSYCILTDKGFSTTRHRRFLRPLVAANDPEIPKESVESNDGDKTTDLPNSDDITEKPVTSRAPPRRSKRTKIPKGSVESRDGEIVTGLPNPADNTEKPDTSRVPLRRSTSTTKPSVQFDQSTRARHTIKCVKMGNKQSEPIVSK